MGKGDMLHISFYYWDAMKKESYREEVGKYLKSIFPKVESFSDNGLKVAHEGFPGQIKNRFDFISFLNGGEREGAVKKLEKVCNYVLSSEREYLPLSVISQEKNFYKNIEDILEKEFDGELILSKGFFNIPGLLGIRNIKKK